jgi:hypothetical protein
MGMGQSLLAILALAILGTIFLTSGRNTLDQRQVIEQCEYEIMATSLATSLVERASSLAFDEKTVNNTVSLSSSLTAVSGLGKDGIESAESSFDDFDDYNNFSKTVLGDTLSFKSANFTVWSTVDYVTISGNAVVTSASQTYHKRLTVWVASDMMRDTVNFQTVYSYWYFR